MKIAIIGATGLIGISILQELINRKHQVIGISNSLQFEGNEFRILKINVLNTQLLAKTIEDYDVVISSYIPFCENSNDMYKRYLMGFKAIQFSTKIANVKRIIVIGRNETLFNDFNIKLAQTNYEKNQSFQIEMANKDIVSILKDEKDLDWLFICPPNEIHSDLNTKEESSLEFKTSLKNLARIIAVEIEIPKYNRSIIKVPEQI